jgi:peptidyl-prolyl cis-trans isomerase A (cyclophilin A)
MCRLFLVSILSILIMSGCSSKDTNQKTLPQIIIETELGNIAVEIDTLKAPFTAKNFLKHIAEERFKGASFYRTVRMDNQPDNDIKIEVIQGGIWLADSSLELTPIRHETTRETGILHKNGTISMARNKPGSASSEFFICIGDQPELDFGGKRNPDGQGFAAFGHVIAGMDVVRKIQQQPDNAQMLITPIQIINIRRK